jgi:hypothetical protein
MTITRFITVTATVLQCWAFPASADVRFGKNVRIGGHDVSNQTFTAKRRGVFNIHSSTPPNEGCSWRLNRDGSKTKVCNWRRKAR